MLELAAAQTPPLNATSGFADSTGLFPTVAGALALVLLVIGMASSVRFYMAVINATGHFANSLEYAIKGVATALILSIIAAPFYLFSTLDSGTKTLVYQAIGAVILGYIALVILGYAGDTVWSQLVKRHEQATGQRPFGAAKPDEAND